MAEPEAVPGLFGELEPAAARLGETLRRAALGLTAALLTARFYWPGEDATEGSGLAWVLGMLVALAVAVAAAWVGGAVRVRWSGADGAFLLLVLLVAASARQAAARRAAINLAWEWGGLAASYVLLRNLPRGRDESAALAGALVATAVAVAAYGLYQVKVEDPQLRLLYRRDPERVLRLAGVPATDPVMRRLFQDRLVGSSEPRATFALANSLAGVLVGPAVLGLAVAMENALRHDRRRGRLGPLLLAAAPLGVVLACLLLTKSRSAYLGLLVGLQAIGWRLRGQVRGRTIALAGAVLVGILTVLAGIAAAAGELDQQVLTESTKSLRYRGGYWRGAWGLITESARVFWGGVGPGNFAGPYLRHKLPRSSEEIVDPHNLLLDVWTSSGVVAATALVAALALGLRATLGPALTVEGKDATPPGSGAARVGWLWWSAAGGWLVVAGVGGLNPFTEDGLARWMVLGWGWALGAVLVVPLWRRTIPGAALGAAALAVLVNLLAAGGIAIPPVALALWAPVALGQDLREDRPCGRLRRLGGRWGAFGLGVFAATLIGIFLETIGPHWRAQQAMNEGWAKLEARPPDFDGARAAFLDAARSDPLAARPWLALADLEYRAWMAAGARPDPAVWIKVTTALDRAAAPPRNPGSMPVQKTRLALLEQLLMQVGEAVAPEVRRAMREDLAKTGARAVRLYPNNPALRVQLAEAAAALGRHDLAARQAGEALRLDALTPHPDKKLAAAVRERLRAALPDWRAEASGGRRLAPTTR